ncbi:hypothetical protein VOLCADRAFT_107102 [Volvox carteri f. nagariensis]|uniref:Uncharacterized protein n=1 Tax=Volvox carteri f. nagariensis TaxID=3068 RepID=D8UBY3_VOLCA|nr:uncharacterized protein VOLCADRAFT_107102 [Volvox carteri f. nagariensis]EFJ42700.1 hypothetical protein VOLCADRAFT_107102 [Volvox carteri f. nagariensis]|eukprot:XP_002956161.1 hypothetical protein VOLCADRAFT_107102 [Volvox carteri f. nagariensis]
MSAPALMCELSESSKLAAESIVEALTDDWNYYPNVLVFQLQHDGDRERILKELEDWGLSDKLKEVDGPVPDGREYGRATEICFIVPKVACCRGLHPTSWDVKSGGITPMTSTAQPMTVDDMLTRAAGEGGFKLPDAQLISQLSATYSATNAVPPVRFTDSAPFVRLRVVPIVSILGSDQCMLTVEIKDFEFGVERMYSEDNKYLGFYPSSAILSLQPEGFTSLQSPERIYPGVQPSQTYSVVLGHNKATTLKASLQGSAAGASGAAEWSGATQTSTSLTTTWRDHGFHKRIIGGRGYELGVGWEWQLSMWKQQSDHTPFIYNVSNPSACWNRPAGSSQTGSRRRSNDYRTASRGALAGAGPAGRAGAPAGPRAWGMPGACTAPGPAARPPRPPPRGPRRPGARQARVARAGGTGAGGCLGRIVGSSALISVIVDFEIYKNL